jgi:PAS domain-containing protein
VSYSIVYPDESEDCPMTQKPTYEALEQRVKELEKEVADHKSAEESLKEKMHLNNILLDAMPCVALLIRPKTREIVLSNEAGRKAGAVPGTTCYEAWAQRDEPCPWCLAPEVWATGKPQHQEVKTFYIIWDAYWHPIDEDLYLHYAFDITEKRKMEKELQQTPK